MPLISEHLRFMAVLILEVFNSWGIKKGQFQFLVFFFSFFFCSVNCPNQFCISPHILNMGNVWTWAIWIFLVFIFLVFSVFKHLKSTFSSNFSWSGNVTVLVCKLYLPGLQIILLFCTCPKFWTIFLFKCF